jgi:5-methyltetrahydropteroyltriglutamate--homocysteine methyltransferase
MSISSREESEGMTKSCDVGSLPLQGEWDKFLEGADHYAAGPDDASAGLFEHEASRAFLDKLKAGIDVPAFPQFRDMNDMFLSTFEGTEKMAGGYVETGTLTVKQGQGMLPEVAVIIRNADRFHAQMGEPFQLRVCVTGPYTLASFFPYRNSQTYTQLGRVLSEVVEKNVFAVKQGKVALVSVDEPLFGVVDDPLIDRGTEGRENLLAAWESIMSRARKRNVETCIHLHRTTDELFWEIESLGVVESHVDDPLYKMKATGSWLEKKDKLLKASVATTDFDRLIKEKLGLDAAGDAVADVWRKIAGGTTDPEMYLEDVGLMKKRLKDTVERFGAERVAMAGTECGLRGFPTYGSAIECLRRVSEATRQWG